MSKQAKKKTTRFQPDADRQPDLNQVRAAIGMPQVAPDDGPQLLEDGKTWGAAVRQEVWEALECINAGLGGLLTLLSVHGERLAECHEAYCLLEPLKARFDSALHVLCVED